MPIDAVKFTDFIDGIKKKMIQVSFDYVFAFQRYGFVMFFPNVIVFKETYIYRFYKEFFY